MKFIETSKIIHSTKTSGRRLVIRENLKPGAIRLYHISVFEPSEKPSRLNLSECELLILLFKQLTTVTNNKRKLSLLDRQLTIEKFSNNVWTLHQQLTLEEEELSFLKKEALNILDVLVD